MPILHENIKLLTLFFLLFSTQLYPWSLWPYSENDKITANFPPNSENNYSESKLCILSQTIGKGPVDARTIVIQNSLISDFSKLFDTSHLTAASSSIQTHWFKIIGAGLLTSYIWILYQIRYTCLLIKQHDAWCNWKSITPLTHLQLTKREDLVSQLKIDMYKKYARDGQLNVSHDHTAIFIQDINSELKTFDTYLEWHQRMQSISCAKLFYFPFDAATIEEKKTRLFFLLDLFMTAQAEKS